MLGVSEIIVIILILMIVVSITGLAYIFFSGILTSTTSAASQSMSQTTKNFMAKMKIESMSITSMYIRNIGQADLANFSIYINDAPANFGVDPPVVKQGQTGTISIYDFIKGGENIRVTTTQNIEMNYQAPDQCSDAYLCLGMDEGSGSTTYDAGGHTNNNGAFNGENMSSGVFQGNVQRVNGKYGKALQFDGSTAYVNVTTNPNIDLMSPFTITAWIYIQPGSFSPYRTILSKKTDSSTSLKYGFLYFNATYLDFYVNTSLNYYNARLPISANNWYHIAGVWNGTHIILYLNGNNSNTASMPGTQITSSRPLLMGYWEGGGAPFNGTVDEVRIYNRSLSQVYIQADMQSSTPIERTLAYWSFEESGQSTSDTHIWTDSKYGKALSLDGADDYINISNPTFGITNLTQYSISFLFKYAQGWTFSAGGRGFLKTMGSVSSCGTDKEIYLYTPDTYSVQIVSNGNAVGSVITLSNPYSWTYIVQVYNGTYMNFYENGILKSTFPYSLQIGCFNQMLIGRGDTGYFNGTIDEVRFYRKAVY